MINRRDFIRTTLSSTTAALATASVVALAPGACKNPLARNNSTNPHKTTITHTYTDKQVTKITSIPSYLKGYEKLYAHNPRQAALKWFADAKFGLFMHYGVYSIMAQGEWVQFRKKIHVAEYAKLKNKFQANKFDADFITDLALSAGMKYINITSRHHDSFCLFETKYTEFNSVNSPAKKDIIAELAQQCHKKGLGLCLYYSHGRDWRHPHAPNNDKWGGNARPFYKTPEPYYAYGNEHHLEIYVEFMKNQITELLTNYGPIAAIWLDGIATPASRPKKIHLFHCPELYKHIHSLQPQVLVSYKQGLIGAEDFLAPEHRWKGKINKPVELCNTLQNRGWGYNARSKHKSPDTVMKMLTDARKIPANLLLNTGPLPDGSIHPADVKTLREVGNHLRKYGFPA